MTESWTSWLDFVPVVGTAKNTVECVTYLIKGDYEKAAEAGGQVFMGAVSDATPGGIGHIAEEAFTKAVVKAANKMPISKVAQLAIEAAANKTPAVRSTLMALLRMLRVYKPGTEEDVQPTKQRSKRGEHVINNSTLRVFRSIIDDFLATMQLNFGEIEGHLAGTRVLEAYYNPTEQDTMDFIRSAVGHIPVEFPYVNANAVVWGQAYNVLRTYCVSYMKAINNNHLDIIPKFERTILVIVHEINLRDLYVDDTALDFWLQQGGKEQVYMIHKAKVATMLERLIYDEGHHEVITWVRELKNAIQHMYH